MRFGVDYGGYCWDCANVLADEIASNEDQE